MPHTILLATCNAKTGSDLAGCFSGVIETDNSREIFGVVIDVANFMYWGLAVLSVISVMVVGWRIILSRIGNDPNQSAQAIKALGYISIALILAASSVTIADLFMGDL